MVSAPLSKYTTHLLGQVHRKFKDTIKPFVKENMPRKFIFQQDNSPVYTANRVNEWLKKNKFKTLDWPAQSPDMNLIKNL